MMTDRFQSLGPVFFLLQTGTSLSQISGHIFRLALAWWCLQETNSAVAFSSLIAFSVAAEVYLKPFLASLGDQFNRVKFIFICQIIILAIMSLFCLAGVGGEFHLAAVTVGLISMSAVIAVREPTIMGLIPDLVGEGYVSKAISRRSAINSVIMLTGPVIAATLISFVSIGFALFTAALLQSSSALTFLRLMGKGSLTASAICEHESWFSKTRGGFTAMYRVKPELHIAIISALINFTMFPFFSVTIPYWISTELHLSASYLGAYEFSFALGLLTGSLYLNTLLQSCIGRFWNVVTGFLLLGCSVIGTVLAPTIYLSIGLAFFSGLAFIFINVNLSTLRATATPGNYRTRMSAMAAFLSSLANPFGVIIAGWYMHWLGVIPFAVLSGIAVILVAPILLWSWHLKNALSLEEVEMQGYYAKTYPDAFTERG